MTGEHGPTSGDEEARTMSDDEGPEAADADAAEAGAAGTGATENGGRDASGQAADDWERIAEARRAIEALVMVAEEPVEAHLLAQLIEIPASLVEEICDQLASEYAASARGFELVRVAGGYQYRSHPDQAAYIERFVLHGRSARLSAAALETLAIIAYKQPVSRAQIAAIRGVNVDGVVRTLERRGYIAEVARDPGPGQAALYGTTKLFLSKLGIDTTDELPPLAGFIPDADIVEALETGLRVADDADVSVDPTSTAAPVEGDRDEVEGGSADRSDGD